MSEERLPTLGKVTPEFFDRVIFPRLGAHDPDVVIGPQHGVDFGAITIGDQVIVLSTDPFFIAPALGWERAAWFALHILASDVAVSGIPPRFFAVDLNLPPEIRESELTTIWQTVHEEAEKLGIAVVSGHTARYAGCNFPMVGGATVIGVGSKDDLIDPRKAEVGDRIIITKGPAIEATGLMAVQFPEFISERYGEEFTQKARDIFFSMSVVEDARICSEIGGMTAMHDATECGIWGALFEIARASEKGMVINKADIVTDDVTLKVCDLFGMEPMSSISEGTLVGTVRPECAADVLAALADAGIPASDVGELVANERGVRVVEDGAETDLVHPGTDPFWGTFEEYLGKQAARK